MPHPRFRFTLWQLIKVVACLAVFFAMLRTPAWPFFLAIAPIIPGFALDRARGGPGIFGSMLAGLIEFLGLGLAALIYSRFSFVPGVGPIDSPSLLVGAVFLIVLGLAWGVCIGTWLWMIALLLGMGTGAQPSPAQPIGSIAWRDFGDQKAPNGKAGGHQA
jgi:hypothetical protein